VTRCVLCLTSKRLSIFYPGSPWIRERRRGEKEKGGGGVGRLPLSLKTYPADQKGEGKGGRRDINVALRFISIGWTKRKGKGGKKEGPYVLSYAVAQRGRKGGKRKEEKSASASCFFTLS